MEAKAIMETRNTKYCEAPVIFLAIFWAGGGPFTISDIIGACDWVNHSIPDRAELEAALNLLLAVKLIERQDDTFLIPKPRYLEFDDFRRKKRKDRFDTVHAFFDKLIYADEAPAIIRLTESEYKIHLKEYYGIFSRTMRDLKKK